MAKKILDQIVIICGMPRTGTTYLYYVLQKHPNIFTPHRKELSFFCSNYDKGISWYESYFKNIQNDQLGIDISPVYFLDANAIDRINKASPKIKLVLCVRKPSDWIHSWYTQLGTRELNMPPFNDFIRKHWFKPTIGKKFLINLDNNFISKTIQQYMNAFEDRILIYHYDLLNKDPLAVLKALEKFLNVPSYFNIDNIENIKINSSNRKNMWLISYLLSREPLAKVLEFCVPGNTLRRVRNYLDKSSVPSSNNNERTISENVNIAKKFFSDDDAFIDSLFETKKVQLGSGKAFDY
ncbi:sulfotransferase family protein [Methylotuvimicrobium sp.]|uniref:sulfotransferase family protein n=1 Tax=Methylotuvimicrobium sp. TaxID=2822413 RepID=UPI003D6490EC